MNDKRAIFINTTWQIIFRVITLAVTLISVKLLANYLGKTGVGEYNTITTYVNFFIVIAELGLFATTVREISKHPENEQRILSNVFTIRLVSALLTCVLAIGLILIGHSYYAKYNINSDIVFGVVIASGFLLFNLLWSIYDMVLQHRLKMQFSALSEFLGKLISIGALALVIIFRGNFLIVVSTITIGALSTFLIKWLFARRFAKFSFAFDPDFANRLLRISIPFGIVFVLNGLYFKLDTLMLYPMKGPDAVGIYSIAYKVLEVVAFFGSYFASSLKPIISREIVSDKKHVTNIINQAVPIMIFMALPITIVCVVFSREIITLVSNATFVDGAAAQNILAFTLPFIYLDVLLSEVLIANDNRRLLLGISGFILLFNLAFNIIAIPRYSYIGAAWGTLVSEIVLFLIYFYFTKKIIAHRLDWAKIMKIILVSAMTFGLGYILKTLDINFLFLVVLTLAGYAIFSYLLQILKISTVRELLRPEAN
ncbi:MAG: flippase [Candidatus Berkelbacteria bacterium]|nr:flippase [Candidatus Berkelbacteria bacterium]